MEQIAVAMNNIYQVTNQGLAGIRQSEQRAAELGRLADKLQGLVEQYRT